MHTTQQQKQPIVTKQDEQILVVKRDHLFATKPAWNGLCKESIESCMAAIKNHQEFQPRSVMEQDPTYKQIIPYLVFHHANRFFFMQRQAKASEQRLKNKYTLGIGGHMRQEDMSEECIFSWAKREFHEEVDYQGNVTFSTLGVLNDDSNAVGQVHIGLVLLLTGNTSDICVKSELKSGQLLTLDEMKPHVNNMESWSQMVYAQLCTI